MGSLQAMQLLSKAAQITQKEKETFSKEEILQKINEIKYLSAQKKVPRLSLRKELLHLENKLQGIMQLEKKLMREKGKESAKIAVLKKQQELLQNKLKATEEKELDQKVEKLSFLLGEYLAKKEVQKEVALQQKKIRVKPPQAKKEEEAKKPDKGLQEKITMLQQRLEGLQQELELHKELETKNPEELQQIEAKISLIKEKLQAFYEKHPEFLMHEMTPVVSTDPNWEVKHQLLMCEEKEDIQIEDHLPLPPPPRMKEKE